MSEIKEDSIQLVKYFSVEYIQLIDCIKEIYVYKLKDVYWIVYTRNNSGGLRLIPKERIEEIFTKEKDDLLKALYSTNTGIKTIKLLK